MSYAGKVRERARAILLRKKGFSIKQIEKELGVARSSVSLWVRDVSLTKKQIAKLYASKKAGSLRGSYIASQNKLVKTRLAIEQMLKLGKEEVGPLSSREKFLIGAALYFAEGDKNSNNVAFSNSDPRAIKFMTDWLVNICKMPKEKIRCYLYIHDNLDENEAKKHWSTLTGIPINQFNKSYIVKNNLKRFRKSKHINGVLRLSLGNVNLLRKIMGWISGIFVL